MNQVYQIHMVKSEQEKADALAVRRVVFVEEQQVPEELEIDEHDHPDAAVLHFVAYAENGRSGQAGCVRMRPAWARWNVSVLASERGTGLGRHIMLAMEDAARQQGFAKLKLNAQTHAQRFYEKLGYLPVGDVFDEAGIEHIAMEKTL